LGARRTKRSELREMEIFDGKHPVLISEDVFNRVQELRTMNGTNCKSRGGAAVQAFPLTGLIFCSRCGNNFRGVSSYGRRYYRDASRIERTCDCPQESVRAEDLELQLVTVIRDLSYNWQQAQQIYNQAQKEEEAEHRLERAKELYIAGEISREAFQVEKIRHENTLKSLQNTHLGATMALAQEMQTSLEAWDSTLPTERKKLLRKAIRAAFVRGDTFVALQPTEAFSPLVELLSGICGEGGIRTRG